MPSPAEPRRRVVLFKGNSQYESLNTMVEQIAAAFARRGRVPALIDLAAGDLARALPPLLADGETGLFFSLNGVGLPAEGQGFYARTDAAVFAGFVDHPIYHTARIRARLERFCVGFPSPSHVAFCRRAHGPTPPCRHVAHAAEPGDPRPWDERDIGVLFTGSCDGGPPEAMRAAWNARGADEARRLNDIVDAHDAAPERPLEQVIADVVGVDAGDLEAIEPLFLAADAYLRARIKADGVGALAGLDAVVCGEGWDAVAAETAGVRFLGPRPAPETHRLMARARVTLNLLPPYYASHERVFQAMAAGSAAATTPSETWAALFGAGEVAMLPYRGRAMADAIRALAAGGPELEAVAAAGAAAFLAGHTWDHRVGEILAFLAEAGAERERTR